MTMDLRDRSHPSELDFTAAEIHHLLDLAADLKAARRGGTERPRLTGRHLALIFEKTSTRTRRAFEFADADQGAATTYPGPGDAHMRAKELVADTARVLGRTFDAIEYRGSAQSTVTELAAHSGFAVHNDLTDTAHRPRVCVTSSPCASTSASLCPRSRGHLGDARTNMGNSLLVMGALLGMDVRIAAHTYGPEALEVTAVIDKDLTAALLAEDLKADFLLILTDVPNVYSDYGTPDQQPLLDATPDALRRGRFPDGSMGPKTEAAARFVEHTGGLAAIGELDAAYEIVHGRSGTLVRPDLTVG